MCSATLTILDILTAIFTVFLLVFRLFSTFGPLLITGYKDMNSKQPQKDLEDCSVSNALGTWVFSIAGALVAIPVGIKRKSLGPLVFFGTTGTMLDIIMGITACEKEHAERQMKLLEAQNVATADTVVAFPETSNE